jgi:hypothetical protein
MWEGMPKIQLRSATRLDFFQGDFAGGGERQVPRTVRVITPSSIAQSETIVVAGEYDVPIV